MSKNSFVAEVTFKNYLWVYSWNQAPGQSFNTSSVSGIFQRWWNLRITWTRWFGFKCSNCSHCCWKLFYWHCLVCVCNLHKICWPLNNVDHHKDNVPKSQQYLLCNYLEKLNVNKKGVVHQRSKNKPFSFTKKVLCIHLLSLKQIIRRLIFS